MNQTTEPSTIIGHSSRQKRDKPTTGVGAAQNGLPKWTGDLRFAINSIDLILADFRPQYNRFRHPGPRRFGHRMPPKKCPRSVHMTMDQPQPVSLPTTRPVTPSMAAATSGSNRRQILATSGMLAAGWLLDRASVGRTAEPQPEVPDPLFKISLTEYSLHRMLAEKKLDPLDFPRFTRETFALDAVEYWNIPFKPKVDDHEYLREMRRRADAANVTGLLILIDGEGELGNPDDQARHVAVERHQKWVTAAHLLGCHSIRVNARSQGDTTQQLQLMVAGLRPLCKFAASMGIHVLVENHGELSSDAEWVSQLIKAVGLPNAGTLPDFNNFDGRDRYQGVQTLMPFAKSVCAKSMDFDDQGNEVATDYERMLKIVVKAGYRGYVGIEYEGARLTEVEGVHATLRLLQRVRDRLNHEADS